MAALLDMECACAFTKDRVGSRRKADSLPSAGRLAGCQPHPFGMTSKCFFSNLFELCRAFGGLEERT